MAFFSKYDYPPLLAPGRHVMTLPDIKAHFVDPFPDHPRRKHLFTLFEEFLQAVLVSGIPCEIWIDGSWLTTKPEPRDLDVTLIVEADTAQRLNADQQAFMHTVSEGAFAQDVDCFAYARLDREHPDFGDAYLDPAYDWGCQYGLESGEQWLKGFVVLKVR
ncbi:hypothetical protein PZ895_17035 [Mesorhizobium sp. YIM 152430]|uniref:DUF6932 family protein n=1 Tax=Mesorhizobium sp. YIM 152430 TaxID=3031761 RepID=UPI0023DAA05E|nr:hypothetical protein [Mesorhizobium sp. YIM 152430]MDF1601465.1 hypothetical protein [Mesorhizobium sp. YIM 152430]